MEGLLPPALVTRSESRDVGSSATTGEAPLNHHGKERRESEHAPSVHGLRPTPHTDPAQQTQSLLPVYPYESWC